MNLRRSSFSFERIVFVECHLKSLATTLGLGTEPLVFLQVVWVGDVCLELLKDVISIQM